MAYYDFNDHIREEIRNIIISDFGGYEWECLYVLISDIEKNYTGKTDTDALEKAVILFDQALLLYHEGNPLPPHLTT